MDETSRRRFLHVLAGAGAFGLGACSSTGGGTTAENVGDLDAGNASALSVGTLRALGSNPACVGRDASGVYAMTLTCTHQACNIATSGSVGASGVACNCHGSRFDANGNVVQGPASAPLAHFQVTADASGNLTVHTGTEVDASTRLAV